ncbi:MAG: hypothetical protein ACPGVB_09445, partial [Chitinophagales bacterium]
SGVGCDSYENIADIQRITTSWGYQAAAARAARIGEHQLALAYWDSSRTVKTLAPLSRKQIKVFKKHHEQTDAIDYILQRAKNEQAVFINEAHHNSQHRNFSKQLLIGLYGLGYRYLGLEALWKKDSINERKFPVQKSGIYTKDPEFANFLRLALDLGFELFAYESSSGVKKKEREIEQAMNIKKILDKDPQAKIFVHAGFGHIKEDTTLTKKGKAMAGCFKEFTGINPLTIDQVDLSERSQSDYENPYRQIFPILESSVFVNKNEQAFTLPSKTNSFDIQVFHPKTNYLNHRPDWKYLPDTKPKFVEEFLTPCTATSGIIAAYKASEAAKSPLNELVPVDMMILKPNHKQPLLLSKGKYVLEICCGDKIITKNIEI